MSHAVILTISAGTTKIHIVEAFILNVPHGVKVPGIVDALQNSQYQANFTEHGVFLANRRIVTTGRIPEGANSDNATSIEWDSIANAGSVQFNVRVPAGDKARYERAAARAGLSVTEWARQVLRDASISA